MTALLCDLDDTLFDHRHATRQALDRLRWDEPALAAWPLDELEARHAAILEELHREVLDGRRSIDSARHERFRRLLEAGGADRVPARAGAAAGRYRGAYEAAWRPVPGAVELLGALVGAGLPVAVVTNNKTAEQRRKLERTGLASHVTALITSEDVGESKPGERIFAAALDALQRTADEVVMLGDAWATDIEGATRAGIRAVWFNPRGLSAPHDGIPEVGALEPTADVLAVLLDGSSVGPVTARSGHVTS